MKNEYSRIVDESSANSYKYTSYAKTISTPRHAKMVLSVDDVEHFILHTKDKDYVLDFQKLLEDYGVEVKE